MRGVAAVAQEFRKKKKKKREEHPTRDGKLCV